MYITVFAIQILKFKQLPFFYRHIVDHLQSIFISKHFEQSNFLQN